MNKLTLLIFCVLQVSIGLAQYKVPELNAWRTHLSYWNNSTIAQNNNQIYVGSISGLFMYDADEVSVQLLTKVNGLSDVEVTKLAFDEETQTLIVVYKNSNVDLIQNGKTYNIRSILDQSIIGDKSINDILLYANHAYLACSFGIVKINLATLQIVDSYQNIGANGTTLAVNDLAVFNQYMYASSSMGLYRASLTSSNLSDFNSWHMQISDSTNQLLAVNGYLLASNSNKILRFDGLNWDTLSGLSGSEIRNIRISQNKILVVQPERIITYDNTFVPTVFSKVGSEDAVLTSKGYYAMAIHSQGLVVAEPTGDRYIIPQGPDGNTAAKFSYSAKHKKLIVSGGYVDGFGGAAGWKPTYNNNKFYIYDGNNWQSVSAFNNTWIANSRDFLDVLCDDKTNKTYLTSFGMGLLELTDFKPTNFYDTSNSTIGYFTNEFITYRPVFAAGTAIDNNGNLWVTSYGAAKPLAVKTTNNQWYSFGLNGTNNAVGFIVCDDAPTRNNKWITNSRGVGLIVYNEGANIASEADDQVKILTKEKGKGALPSNNVLCMALDKNGEMWIGTDAGLCIISNPTTVFSNDSKNSYDARQLIFNTGSFNSIFLGTDAIYSIKVDGANRKWIATRNGVWLVSEDGYTVIRNFTTENSPLLSNVVYDIGIFEETGEVFFATEKGIISYAGDATNADDKHGSVFVYPNPVRPEYKGDIGIRGLANKTNVKITDIAGNLVYETQANGGMATWNCRNFNGNRVATGVYIIYSSNEDATETFVTKILVIN